MKMNIILATLFLAVISTLSHSLLFCEHMQEDIVFLNASQLIHAIKTGNHTKICKNRLDTSLINRVYRNQTPVMIAIDALGSLMLRKEQDYKQSNNAQYKNIVGPALFTLATASACGYVYATETNKEELLYFRNIGEIIENPIAIPGAMLFGGIIWLLPDLYHNIKTLYYRLIASEALHADAVTNRYNIIIRLLDHPDINLHLATKESEIALDTVNKWQQTVTISKYKTMLFNLEQKILEKMYNTSSKMIEQ